MSFTRDQWARAPRMCWVVENEKKHTVSQYDACQDHLGVSSCAEHKRKSKCLRKHACVWSDPKRFKCEAQREKYGKEVEKWREDGEKYIDCMLSAGWADVEGEMKKV